MVDLDSVRPRWLTRQWLGSLLAAATIGLVIAVFLGSALLPMTAFTAVAYVVVDRCLAKRLTGSWMGRPQDIQNERKTATPQ